MQLTYDEKKQIVETLAEHAEEHNVVGIVDMHELPAPQLQQIKKELKDTATITMSRRTLIERGLSQAGEAYTDLLDIDVTQPALLFSDDNPFTLYQTIQAKKSAAPAKEGATAPKDITLEPGQTDLPPGPALGELQALGAETTVEDGKIKITNNPVAVEAGDTITRDDALTLNKLGLKPLEVGLDMKAVVEDGVLYTREQLDIDIDQYKTNIERGTRHAFNLAIETGFITPETVTPLLRRGATHATNLAVESGYITEDTVETLVAKAYGAADALDSAVDTASVDVDDDAETGEAASGETDGSGENSSEDDEPGDTKNTEVDAGDDGTGADQEDKDDETDAETSQTQPSEDRGGDT